MAAPCNAVVKAKSKTPTTPMATAATSAREKDGEGARTKRMPRQMNSAESRRFAPRMIATRRSDDIRLVLKERDAACALKDLSIRIAGITNPGSTSPSFFPPRNRAARRSDVDGGVQRRSRFHCVALHSFASATTIARVQRNATKSNRCQLLYSQIRQPP